MPLLITHSRAIPAGPVYSQGFLYSSPNLTYMVPPDRPFPAAESRDWERGGVLRLFSWGFPCGSWEVWSRKPVVLSWDLVSCQCFWADQDADFPIPTSKCFSVLRSLALGVYKGTLYREWTRNALWSQLLSRAERNSWSQWAGLSLLGVGHLILHTSRGPEWY